MNDPAPDYSDIISRFLPHRLARFVRQVDQEARYYLSPPTRGRPGYLRRDAVRFKLVGRAYRRYSATVPTLRVIISSP